MKKYLIIGLLLLLGTNAVVLSGVAYNRAAITSQLNLTERELPLPYNLHSETENSGVALRINWRIPSQGSNEYSHYGYNSVFVDEVQLEEWGFNANRVRQGKRTQSKTLYWALEFDGELYQQALAIAESEYQTAEADHKTLQNKKTKYDMEAAFKRLNKEHLSSSRLFFLEAANDLTKLRKKHEKNSQVIIVKGKSNINYREANNDFSLRLETLLVKEVLLTSNMSKKLSTLEKLAWDDFQPARYEVTINWGNRFEPWIENISL